MHFIFATERKVDLNGTIKLSLVTIPPNTVFPCNVLRIHCASHCFLVLEVEECGVNFVWEKCWCNLKEHVRGLKAANRHRGQGLNVAQRRQLLWSRLPLTEELHFRLQPDLRNILIHIGTSMDVHVLAVLVATWPLTSQCSVTSTVLYVIHFRCNLSVSQTSNGTLFRTFSRCVYFCNWSSVLLVPIVWHYKCENYVLSFNNIFHEVLQWFAMKVPNNASD